MNNDLLPIKILIIDDDKEECEIIKRAFELVDDINVCGFANDGVLGIEMARNLQPDVILLDVVMPNIDGIEVAKRICESNFKKSPRIIMLTAIGNQNIINEAFEVGVDYYLRKPVNLVSLVEKVRMVYKNIGCNDMCDGHKSNIKIIKETVQSIGIPVNLTGYKYIVQVLEIMLNESHTFKEMYEMIANRNNTSNQCVEISIRNAIKKSEELKNDFYMNLFGRSNKCPSNSVFLETVKEAIYMKIPD